MKKLINNAENCVLENLEGFIAAHGNEYELVPETHGIKVKGKPDKTVLITGGGSGHEPMFAYFVGKGLADAAACGNIFASPDPGTIVNTVMSVENGKGALFVYGNYSGDDLNFDMAAELLEDFGVETRTVRVMDDVVSAPKERADDRRGIAGMVFALKIAGAATASGLSLNEAYEVVSKARDNLFSIGIGLSGATIPGQEKPIFTLEDDEIEFGLGIHGEPGIKRMKMMSADEITDMLFDRIIEESGIKAGDTVCTLVNGLGSTTVLELNIVNRRLNQRLHDAGICIHDMMINSFVTSQEMAGASITLFKVDDELRKYYDMPCDSAYLKK